MKRERGLDTMVVTVCAVALWAASAAEGNEGPFVLKYPQGDPVAQGILARLDPDLRPARETRLRVLEETLEVDFNHLLWGIVRTPSGDDRHVTSPRVGLRAIYKIENPTEDAIEIDFGFPVVRGIYENLFDVRVSTSGGRGEPKDRIAPRLVTISYSVIYGIIRERARKLIEAGIGADQTLARLVGAIRGGGGEGARQALAAHLTGPMKWNGRDAALMVEYASLDLGKARSVPPDRDRPWYYPGDSPSDEAMKKLLTENLGPLSAIGEQKATQVFAQLAARFDPAAAAGYEAIFTAWGGDVRERSVDLATGRPRPREFVLEQSKLPPRAARDDGELDPTVYARVDYLDPHAGITEAEKVSCQAVLKNLPVVFSFAPMSLVHYQVRFEPKTTYTVEVWYVQHAYIDTRRPRSYQIAYVIHPASYWASFGPIRVKLHVPDGVECSASVALGEPVSRTPPGGRRRIATRQTTLEGEKAGELLFAVDADAWDAATGTKW